MWTVQLDSIESDITFSSVVADHVSGAAAASLQWRLRPWKHRQKPLQRHRPKWVHMSAGVNVVDFHGHHQDHILLPHFSWTFRGKCSSLCFVEFSPAKESLQTVIHLFCTIFGKINVVWRQISWIVLVQCSFLTFQWTTWVERFSQPTFLVLQIISTLSLLM